MGKKMPWLKTRLRQINQTPAGLARHLGLYAPRVYEMIAGRRQILPDEIAKTAEFLQWDVPELLNRMPKERRVLPTVDGQHRLLATRAEHRTLVPVVSTIASASMGWDAIVVRDAGPARFLECREFSSRTDVFCMYQHSTRMEPWRQEGELVLAEKEKPPKDLDHVIIYQTVESEVRVLIRQLLHTTESIYRVRQHNPGKRKATDGNIGRDTVTSIYRVLTWDDVFR